VYFSKYEGVGDSVACEACVGFEVWLEVDEETGLDLSIAGV